MYFQQSPNSTIPRPSMKYIENCVFPIGNLHLIPKDNFELLWSTQELFVEFWESENSLKLFARFCLEGCLFSWKGRQHTSIRF